MLRWRSTAAGWLIIAPAKARALMFLTEELLKTPSCKSSAASAHRAPTSAPSHSKRSANAPLSFASRPNSTKSFLATLPRSKPRNLLTLYPALLDLRTSSAKKARTRGAGQSRRATLETGLVALTRCLMMIENSKPQHCAMLCMQPPAVCRRPAPLLFSRVRVQAGAHCDQLISQSVKQQRRQRRQQQTAPSLAL